jgi:hypothetical protein
MEVHTMGTSSVRTAQVIPTAVNSDIEAGSANGFIARWDFDAVDIIVTHPSGWVFSSGGVGAVDRTAGVERRGLERRLAGATGRKLKGDDSRRKRKRQDGRVDLHRMEQLC